MSGNLGICSNMHGPYYVLLTGGSFQVPARQPEQQEVALKRRWRAALSTVIIAYNPIHTYCAALLSGAGQEVPTLCRRLDGTCEAGPSHQTAPPINCMLKYSHLESSASPQTTTTGTKATPTTSPNPLHYLDHNRLVLQDGASGGRHHPFSAPGCHQVGRQLRSLRCWRWFLACFPTYLPSEEQRRRHARFHPRRQSHSKLQYDTTPH